MSVTEDKSRRSRRLALLVLAGFVPAVLLTIAVVNTILNHFFAHGPYLLDAGWYSDIVYRAGVFQRNPEIACTYAEWYWGVHPSVYCSLFSLLSYLQPLPRIEWYALFEATVFLPFAWAVYALASRIDPDRSWPRVAIAAVAALAFTFYGQIVRMIPYPHYEVAIAAYICLLLVMLATGRTRWAWVCFALALSIREDAGVHTAMALSPLVYLKWRGVAMPPKLKTLLVMCGIAFGATLLGSLSQKLVFHGPSIMGIVYLGDPIYSHIDADALIHRAGLFLSQCQFLYLPFLATCGLAIARRDARYLLGWAAGAPWFVLNFLAAQEQKATFDAYSGFPYVGALFWVYVYGAVLAPAPRRLRVGVLEAVFAALCLTSTIGLYVGNTIATRSAVSEMQAQPRSRASVHAFVNGIARHRAALGKLYVDYSVAALALEVVRSADEGWTRGVRDATAMAFHTETVTRDELLPDVLLNGLDECSQPVHTQLFLCTKQRLPLDVFGRTRARRIPALFAFATLDRDGLRFDDQGIVLEKSVVLDGWIGRLPKGHYTLTTSIESEPIPPETKGDLAVVQILVGGDIRAEHSVPIGSHELSVEFDASGGETLWFRYGSRVWQGIRVKDAHVRAR